MRIAVIDTGTNSTRLLVAAVDSGGLTELERLTTVTRLGEGVDSGGSLHAEARERVLACIDGYALRIKELKAARTVVLATSSIRDASDGVDFLQSLAYSRGFEWKMLSGEEEAHLSFSGATLETEADMTVTLFDVGGGSTEVVSGIGDSVKFARSLAIGCVRLTERFIKSDPPSRRELEDAAAYIDGMIDKEIGFGSLPRTEVTMAVAGTATTLAAIDLGLEQYDRSQIHGHVIPAERIAGLLERLASVTIAQNLEIKTIEKGRADVVVAGALILERLMHQTGAPELLISELDILDGAALAVAAGRI